MMAHRAACPTRRVAGLLAGGMCVAACTVALAGCGEGDGSTSTEVVLVTHESFAISEPVRRAFERQTGLTLRILQGGDAGATLNTALLTSGDPQGDVLFGVDDSLLSRALGDDLLLEHRSPALAAVDPAYAPPDPRLTPVDHGEVCLNVDVGWFARRKLAPPATLEELTLPRYRDLLVVENAATSSPGLAFLLATVVRFDTLWQGYWRKLRLNGVLVVDGWEEAYTQQFSGAAGSTGKRPIVVSYATSPAAEVIFASKPVEAAPTVALEDGCFRQVEYAGILRGAANEAGGRKLLDFMLSVRFQTDVPGSMFVYPVRRGVPLPGAFRTYALAPSAPLTLPPEEIAANRDAWVNEWTDIVVR